MLLKTLLVTVTLHVEAVVDGVVGGGHCVVVTLPPQAENVEGEVGVAVSVTSSP